MRAVLICGFALMFLSWGTAFGADEPVFGIRELKVLDQVGDPLIDAAYVQHAIEVVLQLDGFVRFRGTRERHSEFDTNGYHRIRNVFAPSGEPGTEPVEITLEIENVYYGPRLENVNDAIMQAWFLGPVLSGLMNGKSDVAMGLVQYRLTVHGSNRADPVVTIGQGVMAGKFLELSRVDALQEAANRAAWDLGFSVVEAMNKAWDLGIESEFVSAEFHEYESAIENWMEAHQ